MKNTKKLGYLILVIAFILLSVVVFVLPTEKNAVFWIAYCFTILAFGIQIVIWRNALSKSETLKSKFLGIPLVHVGLVYLIIQVVAFGVFIAAAPIIPIWAVIIVSVLILGISSICLITAEVGKEEISKVEQKVQRKVFALKSLQVDVEMMASSEKDEGLKKALLKLSEKIKYSDPMSSEELSTLENQISARICELKTADKSLLLIEEIDQLITERNAKCKTLKN